MTYIQSFCRKFLAGLTVLGDRSVPARYARAVAYHRLSESSRKPNSLAFIRSWRMRNSGGSMTWA